MTFVKNPKSKTKKRDWKQDKEFQKNKRNQGHRPRKVKKDLWIESIND